MAAKTRKLTRQRIHARIRKALKGTTERPRLAVYFSNNNVYAQIIDDDQGKTIVSASTKEKGFGEGKANDGQADGERGRRGLHGLLVVTAVRLRPGLCTERRSSRHRK